MSLAVFKPRSAIFRRQADTSDRIRQAIDFSGLRPNARKPG
jgi:hypothetical protein